MNRGVRNHNPLNIRKSKDKWQGQSANQTDFAFVVFDSDYYGFRAAFKILKSYFKRNICSISAIVSTWAPPVENHTANYIKFVSDHCNYPADAFVDPLDSVLMCNIVYYMAVMETACHYDKSIIVKSYSSVFCPA